MQRRIYTPSAGLESWRTRLADPDEQWVRSNSAFETAVFWELGAREPRGLHPALASFLDKEESLQTCELVASFPEHRVCLPGGSRASQTDVWSILRVPSGLVSLAVEGKAGETFAETVGEWRKGASDGKEKRLTFLCEELGLSEPVDDSIRYQLLHRTVSALLEGDRIGAAMAVMVVLSFRDDARSKADFRAFLSCLGAPDSRDRPLRAPVVRKRPLFLGWLDVPTCTDADIAAVAV